MNLVANGDAEAAPGAPATNTSVFTPSWNILLGGFTAVVYAPLAAVAEHFPIEPGIPGPLFGGSNLLYGGPSAVSNADQQIALGSIAADINCGAVSYALDGWLGGWQDHPDLAELRIFFLDGIGNTLAVNALPPATVFSRGDQTGMWHRSATGWVPAGTASARILYTCNRYVGTDCDGYLDDLSLVLTQNPCGSMPTPTPTPTAIPTQPCTATAVLHASTPLWTSWDFATDLSDCDPLYGSYVRESTVNPNALQWWHVSDAVPAGIGIVSVTAKITWASNRSTSLKDLEFNFNLSDSSTPNQLATPLLLTDAGLGPVGTMQTDTISLPPPVGGWNWSSVNGLAVSLAKPAGGSALNVSCIEFDVTYSTCVPPGPSNLVKTASLSTAAVGDTLTFTLAYSAPAGSSVVDDHNDLDAGNPPANWSFGNSTPATLTEQGFGYARFGNGDPTVAVHDGTAGTDGTLEVQMWQEQYMSENGIVFHYDSFSRNGYVAQVENGGAGSDILRLYRMTAGALTEIGAWTLPGDNIPNGVKTNITKYFWLRVLITGCSYTLQFESPSLAATNFGPVSDCTYASGRSGYYKPTYNPYAAYNELRWTGCTNFTGLVLWDSLDSHLAYGGMISGPALSSGPAPLAWNIGALACGAGGQIRFWATVASAPASCSLANTAEMSTDQLGVETSNTVSIAISGACGSTPTFTPSRTPSPTPTPTRSATPSPSSTRTATSSPTPTLSPSASATLTATPSRTPTSTETVTKTATSTCTATPTATATATCTYTLTATQSATLTATPTATETQTRTGTLTFTPTPTETPTGTPTPSYSAAATLTATSSETVTSTDTLTRTPTSTATGTPTAAPTATITFTPTNTATFSGSPTCTATLTPSRSSTQSSTYTGTPTATITLTPSLTSTATPTGSPSCSATVSATPTPSLTSTCSSSPTSTQTPTPTFTDTATQSPSFSASPSNTPSFTITVTPEPRPYRAKAAVYNSAGELVRIIYQGDAGSLPASLPLDRSVFVAGADLVTALLPGSFSGAGAITWDGANALGAPVSGGVYTIKMELIDPFGLITSLSTAVSVLAGPDRARLTLSNSAGEILWWRSLSAGISSFSLDTSVLVLPGEGQDPSHAAGLQVHLKDNSGTVLALSWDGRSANGALARSGIYTLQLSGGTGDGPRNVQSASISILRGPDKVMLEDAFIAPNPAEQGQRAQLCYSVIDGMTASAGLYSLSGERIAAYADPAAAGKLVMDLEGLASGVYLCVVRQGGKMRVLKLAVLH